MIKTMSISIVEKMVDLQIIDESDAPVQRYGLELATSFVMTMMMLMVLAIFTHRAMEVVWAVVPFCLLRAFSGGWHANTHFKCMSLFIGMIILELLVIPSAIGDLLMSKSILMTLMLVTIISVFTFAPVESITKPLSIRERHHYKQRSRLSVVILSAINLLTFIYLSPILGAIAILSTTMQALSLIPSIFNQESMPIKE